MVEELILKNVVFYDPDYIGSWISDEDSILICEYFEERNYKILNAEELLTWVEYIRNTPYCKASTLIFSQDVVPATVYVDVNTRQPIFRYLRSGGKIIWIGDVPFHYRGISNARNIHDLPVLGFLGLKNLLTVERVREDFVSEVNFTVEGKRLGLRSGIMGSRPVYITHGLVPLATSFDTNGDEVANMWIKMGFVRLFDINRKDDILFDVRDHLDEIYKIAQYPIDQMVKDAQGKRDVFVVHGHDRKSRDQITELLKKHNLRPRFLNDYSTGSETLVDLLEKAQECAYVIIVLTPDDYAIDSSKFQDMKQNSSELKVKDWIDALQPRGRQNVIFEFGFFRGLFGKERVCVLLKDHPSHEWDIPSDINGVYYSKYSETVFEKEMEIVNRLKRAGLIS